MTATIEDALRRDAEAQCVDPACHQTSADRRVLAGEVRRLRSLVRQWSQAADMLQRDARVLEKEVERLRLEVISAEQVLAAFVEDSDDDQTGMEV